MKKLFLYCISLLLLPASIDAGNYTKSGNSLIINVIQPPPKGVHQLRLEVVGDKIIRVQASPRSIDLQKKSLIIIPQKRNVPFHINEDSKHIKLITSSLIVSVDKENGQIIFSDKSGQILLKEAKDSKSFVPITVERTNGYSVRDAFETDNKEALYGLGQHQADEFNYKGKNEELFQYNTKVSIPFIVSTKNYGLLWDSYSLLRFGDKRPYSQLNRLFKLYDKEGKEGALTGTYIYHTSSGKNTYVRQEDSLYFENLKTIKNLPAKVPLLGSHITYEGDIEAPESGPYHFVLYYAGYMKVYVNHRLIVPERWRTAWNPNSYKFIVNMTAGQRVPLKIEWNPDGENSYCGLRALSPLPVTEQKQLAFWGEMQDDLDYYFIAGHSMDDVIHGYRTLTGKAPIMPKWAMGYWQSRDKYNTQDEVLNTFKEFRNRKIPIDNIVQDWSYWKVDSWGDQEFDRNRYPHPKAMMDSIHAMHGHLMISVWPKFYPTTANFKELNSKGYIYQQALKDSVRDWIAPGYLGSFYDPYSQEARNIFWEQINKGLYSKGIDAWWMDASEPDIVSNSDIEYRKKLCDPTAIGPSTKYFNTYALMNAKAIYEGQRKVNPNTRVFLLTRSGFAGLQRFSTATWSGDIGSRWEDMKAQISAGLNYAMSGIPYWTMDIGGYCTENRYSAAQITFDKTGIENDDLKEWRELNVRWHQFGAFAPLYRSHGKFPLREIWNIAPSNHPAYKAILFYDKLRYRLMPYIYSLAGMTYFKDYTIMRALAMDFEKDKNVYDIADQYMFGPSLMVCPVYTYKARNRSVYFPKTSDWYDFYSGNYITGGKRQLVDAPYERMPLFVRAGAIIPLGPDMQYSDEKKPGLINLYVYEGADGKFLLYEDEGTNYNYEKGKYTIIDFTYDDAKKTLTVGNRIGNFEGMLKERRFNIVFVKKNRARAYESVPKGKPVNYTGKRLILKL